MNQILHIKDFKLLEDFQIPLKNLTVIAGGNSVGKSTVIQAILLLRHTFDLRQLFPSSINSLSIPLNGPFLMELGNTSEVVRKGKKMTDSFFSFSILEKHAIVASAEFEADRSNFKQYEVRTTKDSFIPQKGITAEKFYYLCTERIGPRLNYKSKILPFLHAGYQGESTFQVLSGEDFPPVALEKLYASGTNPLFIEQSKGWLNYIIPGASFDSAQSLGKSGIIEGTYGGCLPTNVGFGVSYVLPIIVNGLLAEPGSIMIVENPESHLHPSGQSKIGRFLAAVAATGVQVIIETHSDQLINGIRIASLKGKIEASEVVINFFSRDLDSRVLELRSIDLNSTGNLSSYPPGFFDQEQQDFAEIVKIKRTKLTK